MNPPSALHGAMSRERKPFTYTPGGLDLSEIKSERMAKRLMRNAMNQGVPDTPVHSVQSPPMPSSPVIVPNYNCLAVQVFPSFNLPANPKSLLRTRSIPNQPLEPSVPRYAPPSQFVNRTEPPGGDSYDRFSRPTQPYTQINKNRPASLYEYSTPPNNPYYAMPTTNYNNEYVSPTLPEISYDAQYFSTQNPKASPMCDKPPETESVIKQELAKALEMPKDEIPNTFVETPLKPALEISTNNVPSVEKPGDNEREVKVVKKTVKKEQKSSEQNGDQNGDANIEAELTVKLPTKKSSGKTETKVEVVKKVLPDGSVEEVKTTTTKTTIDGRTEIKTKTETTITPKDDEEEVEVEEEEEEEQGNGEVIVEEVQDGKEEVQNSTQEIESDDTPEVKENGQDDSIIKTEERSDTTTTTTKKVVVVQSDEEPEEEIEEEQVEEEEEEVQESEPVVVVVKKKTERLETPPLENNETEEAEEEEDEEVVEEKVEVKKDVEVEEKEEIKKEVVKEETDEIEEDIEKEVQVEEESKVSQPEEEEEVEEEEEYEEAEEVEVKKEKNKEEIVEAKVEEKAEETPVKEEVEIKTEVESEKPIENVIETKPTEETVEQKVTEQKEEEQDKERIIKIERPEAAPQTETKVPLREPSIPLDKVEDIEIKPIGPAGVITKTHTEKTEIITSTSPQPPGVLSKQTEYNRVENIVTVNRTTKTLDNTFENVPHSVPDVKSYYAPSRILASPMPSRPYQPVYPSEPTTERRHSLLLERLSVERQMPSEIYHNQTYEQQRQWSQEPQSEILTISNVKPSSITNQQWYQQRDEINTTYNSVTPTPPVAPTPTPSWTQPQPKPQPQPTYKPQATYPAQQTYQPSPTPQTYQPSPTPQPSYQPPPAPQPQYQAPATPQPQYQPSYADTNAPSSYTSYTPKPTVWPPPKFEAAPPATPTPQPTHYSTDSYQKTTQQYSSSYVPPPWEQDQSYVVNNSQSYYQPPPSSASFTPTPTPTQSWKPPAPKSKFSKTTPTSYIPPAPNQSFVKPVNSNNNSKPLPNRKTYYSEYERRYISVPETTYVPQEAKYQPQPDPSPQYYYDNNEPTETVEHQWRKELREFTEKSSQTQTEQTSVRPPWEVDPKYAKTSESTFTQAPTPTWSQTLRPRSWREKSFESEFVGSQEWPKTNTLGRGRPLSTYSRNESTKERTRGVSVDRYNPNNYQSPSSLEHPPVQTHTLNPNMTPHTGYHNPNVPAYHSRASAEPREQGVSYKQPRAVVREPRASPFQSRSFKYLQWITGTDD